jgi:hypothetical protein
LIEVNVPVHEFGEGGLRILPDIIPYQLHIAAIGHLKDYCRCREKSDIYFLNLGSVLPAAPRVGCSLLTLKFDLIGEHALVLCKGFQGGRSPVPSEGE